MPFTLYSCNIRAASYEDGINAWPERAPLMAHSLAAAAPDVCCFQEWQAGNAHDLRAAMRAFHGNPGLPYNRPGRVFRCPVMWRTARFRRLEHGSFLLAPPGHEHWRPAWNGARSHVCTWALLHDRHCARSLLVCTTHLDHLVPESRERSTAMLLAWLERRWPATPTILCGDFNCGASLQGEAPWSMLLAAGFHDALGDREPGFTAHAFSGREAANGRQPWRLHLDWLLYRGDLQLLDSAIDTRHNGEVWPSDHFPIRGRFGWG